jgi:hypothetical protein
MIGLGLGLTPSGDDFFCGAMTALHYLGRKEIALLLAERVLPVAARDTNLISAAYLRCASAGQASGVLFDTLKSVLAGGDARLESRLDAVHAVGHTSGWDSLAGAAAACAAFVAASPGGHAGGSVRRRIKGQDSLRTISIANSAACALDGATITPASFSSCAWRE